MKMHLFIDDPEKYLEGDYSYCFRLHQEKDLMHKYYPEWEYCGEVEIPLPGDDTEIRSKAIEAIDEKAKQIKATAHAAVVELENRKQNLLALEHIK